MQVQLYYFSGTGNSLSMAREIGKRLPGSVLVPIVGALKKNDIKTTAETVGIVFPIHNLSTPKIVDRFLSRADLSSARYIFAVATRFCSDRVFLKMDRMLKKQGKKINAWFSQEMVCNYLPLFRIPPEEAINRMELNLPGELDRLTDIVSAARVHRPRDSFPLFLISRFIFFPVSVFIDRCRFPGMARSFYADEACTGCGVCQGVCLADRIRVVSGRPVWDLSKECLYCFACLHYCPAGAIQLKGRKTAGKGRYHHTAVRVADIADQKRVEG
ncbi:MAG: EFR1 family ferrodoxin [Spirochaetales bacterium]|nr:EFR1 family ferrodoxin [Spirochaetales bacterium]